MRMLLHADASSHECLRLAVFKLLHSHSDVAIINPRMPPHGRRREGMYYTIP